VSYEGDLARTDGVPLVDVTIDIQSFYRSYLETENGGAMGIALPVPVRGRALIDTGASMSCVCFPIAEQLQLMRIGAVTFRGVEGARTPNRSAEQAPIFGAMMQIPALGWRNEVRLVGVQPDPNHIAILGRDILSAFRLEYNGPSQTLRLSAQALQGA